MPQNVTMLNFINLHKDVVISENNNPKRKPKTALFYQTKVGVDALDQMSKLYSVKTTSRRWPIHIFYNAIDMALINSWVINKAVCKSSISRRVYIQKYVKSSLVASMVLGSR